MTPEEYALADRTKAFLAYLEETSVEAARQFADAVRPFAEELAKAFNPPAPVLPPEPPIGANVRDRDGDLWRHVDGGWKSEDLPIRSWEALIDDWGPVERLFPATDVAELTGALRAVADAYRLLIAVVREHGTPIPPDVFEARRALVPVDALLARFEPAS